MGSFAGPFIIFAAFDSRLSLARAGKSQKLT